MAEQTVGAPVPLFWIKWISFGLKDGNLCETFANTNVDGCLHGSNLPSHLCR
jgi:hypothetical protein